MLEGKIALVTGASRGIGRQIAKTLAAKGAFVIVNYNGSAAKAEEVVKEIQAAGGNGQAVQCNVSDFESCKEMLDAVVKEHGRLDILVNNAGITRDNLLMKMSEEDFDAVIQTNLKGVFNCTRHIARQMLKQKSGRIINISSVSGVLGNAGQANYCAAKAGVIGLTKSAAKELASRGITVNAVAPGFIKTEMTDVLKDDIKKAIMENIPMKAFGETEDIANAVAFLASEEARYITGQVISDFLKSKLKCPIINLFLSCTIPLAALRPAHGSRGFKRGCPFAQMGVFSGGVPLRQENALLSYGFPVQNSHWSRNHLHAQGCASLTRWNSPLNRLYLVY